MGVSVVVVYSLGCMLGGTHYLNRTFFCSREGHEYLMRLSVNCL